MGAKRSGGSPSSFGVMLRSLLEWCCFLLPPFGWLCFVPLAPFGCVAWSALSFGGAPFSSLLLVVLPSSSLLLGGCVFPSLLLEFLFILKGLPVPPIQVQICPSSSNLLEKFFEDSQRILPRLGLETGHRIKNGRAKAVGLSVDAEHRFLVPARGVTWHGLKNRKKRKTFKHENWKEKEKWKNDRPHTQKPCVLVKLVGPDFQTTTLIFVMFLFGWREWRRERTARTPSQNHSQHPIMNSPLHTLLFSAESPRHHLFWVLDSSQQILRRFSEDS